MKNSDLFWMKTNDVQKGLGVKNISDLIIKKIKAIFNTKNPQEDQIKEYKLSLADLMNNHSRYSNKIKYARSDLIKKIIKNFRGVKKSNRDNTNRENCRILLGFKENDRFITKEESVLIKIMKVFSIMKYFYNTLF